MEPKMSDFLQTYGSPSAYLQDCPQGSHIKMLPYDKRSSKWIHECILRWDPYVFRDHRQADIVRCLREARYFLVCLPSSFLPEEGVAPLILGYCICSETTVTPDQPPWLKVVSCGVLPDNRRLGIATRLIRQAASFNQRHPIFTTIEPALCPEFANLWKKRGATVDHIGPTLEPSGKSIYHFILSYSQLFSSQKFVQNAEDVKKNL